ncbi:hypothetical protein P154DRAFT_598783 [Amniculicola lignicola CBS 123094]|uniref:AAA+ ATPase domain-containing protein n=1 Tax=Amniculicola lignicola CBS 123094 TaxID=1392246 RepID=A0A6A5WMS3_9PLEO|nr:hypothetical protein P154DRAFT_598783 [Amniculicola lignicola CBS 123094]
MDSTDPANTELQGYQNLLIPADNQTSEEGRGEGLRIAPLIWWDVKKQLDEQQAAQDNEDIECGMSRLSVSPPPKATLQQYAVLGHVPEETQHSHRNPVLLNTASPWSAFLCGSQGSGKSHTLSCMLENCLLDKPSIGKNPNPLAGLVFHYDSTQGSGVCEAAYLCSHIPTTVLILRDMALAENGYDAVNSKTTSPFTYSKFKQNVKAQLFTDKQNGPLNMRIELLESFIRAQEGKDALVGRPGHLTIIDLTDPVVDTELACVLFDICLSVFVAQTPCAKIVALDEAHNYMSDESAAVSAFTGKLLKTIREQRHLGTRVVIATQEPTLNTKLLDLCSITMIHRCTSPAWFVVLKKHVAGLFLDGSFMLKGESDGGEGLMESGDKAVFQRIVQLKLGESLLFCPTAAIAVTDGTVRTMEDRFVRFMTRKRVTADGGVTRTVENM